MNCSKCQTEITDSAKFCGKCGTQTPLSNTPAKAKRPKSILMGFVFLLVFIVVFDRVILTTLQGVSSITSPSKKETIEQLVQQVKSNASLPRELNEITIWTDITAQPNAVRYHYVFHDIEEGQVSNAILKDFVVPLACQNTDTRSILDSDINMEYSYTIRNEAETFLISVSRNDCL